MSIFSLGNAFLTAFSFADSLFGGSSKASVADMFADEDAGLFDTPSSTASGFIQKGAQMFLQSQGKAGEQPFQSATFERPRSVKELTRGAPSLSADMMPIAQQRLYQMPEVSQYWDRLIASQNQHVRNVMAAADVEPTVRSGRKTKVLGTETTLKGEVGVV